MTLKDKVVIITGGAKGFGRALAEEFIAEGSKVLICSLHKDVEKTAEELGIIGVKADIRQEDDMTTLAQLAINKYGHIDIWINNAGVWMMGSVEESDLKEVRKLIDTNVLGTINGSRVALRFMKEKNSGTLINVISKVALVDDKTDMSIYAGSKWGINGFTKTIREENKDSKISILSVFPGGMKTSLFGKNKPEEFDQYMDPKDVAKKVIANLKKDKPEEELKILRENQ